MIAQMLLALTFDVAALGVLALAGIFVLGVFLMGLTITIKLLKTAFGGKDGQD